MPARPGKPLLVVVGATGTGKSQLAVDLALRFNGEVINGDAMQLYEGLPVITNQIKPIERKGVTHHLLGCISLRQTPWTVHDYVGHALATIDDIHSRGKLPVLVGGTHYYLQSLLFEDSVVPNTEQHDDGQDVDSTATSQSWPVLDAPTSEMFAELRRVDPAMAARWHPNDRRKIRRSLEIYLKTGERASEVYERQKEQREVAPDTGEVDGASLSAGRYLRYPTLLFWTDTSKEMLWPRLDRRVDAMIDEGLLDEVSSLEAVRKSLIDEGRELDESSGIWVSIGYKEFREYSKAVHEGWNETQDRLRKDAVEQTKTATRQYSRSQLRWLRKKLVLALRDAEAPTMFVMNSDSPANWESEVLQPAAKLTQLFLAHDTLPDPCEQSDRAKELLTSSLQTNPIHDEGAMRTQTCELCGITAGTQQQWQQHVSSRRHRNTLRAKSRMESSSPSRDELT